MPSTITKQSFQQKRTTFQHVAMPDLLIWKIRLTRAANSLYLPVIIDEIIDINGKKIKVTVTP